MPIKGLSELVRMPRLGKIRLGIKVEREGKPSYPKATDYFVVPDEVAAVFGKEPKELEIMFPCEDSELFAPQYLRCYSLSLGLVCIGDGEFARRKVDTTTGAMAGHESENWVWKKDLICNPQDCPEYISKRCKRVMNLLFLIPALPSGLGVFQIDTSSFFSILNLNSIVKLLGNLAGRCSFIPLTMSLGKQEVTPPGIKKKTVNVLQFRNDQSLTKIAQIGLKSAARVLLPEIDDEEVPSDLFPEEVLIPECAESVSEEEPVKEEPEDFLEPFKDPQEGDKATPKAKTKPMPKAKPIKGAEKVNTFIDLCVQDGFDITKLEDMLKIGKWIEDAFGVKRFADLTEESQDKAIAMIEGEIACKAKDAIGKPEELTF